MSRGLLFITKKNPEEFSKLMKGVFNNVVEVDDKIDGHANGGAFLVSHITTLLDLSYNDFKEAIELTNDPENILGDLDNFYHYHAMIIIDIEMVNKVLLQIDDLVILINFPKPIYMRKLREFINNDISFDWYRNEDAVCTEPIDY